MIFFSYKQNISFILLKDVFLHPKNRQQPSCGQNPLNKIESM